MEYAIVQIGRPDKPMSPSMEQVIAALDEACFHETLPRFDLGWWWAAKYRGVPVAYAAMREAESTDEPALFFSRAGVVETHRGHGLQLRLIKARMAYCKRRFPGRLLTTYTHASNVPSNNNLILAGWKLWTPPKTFSGDCWLYWRKEAA